MRQTQLPIEKEKWAGGIDEAGRGAVLGPLVIAGVAFPEIKLGLLGELGVKDSKQLSPEKRRILFEKIIELAPKWKIVELSPERIDAAILSRTSNLNLLEMQNMADICLALAPDQIYIDALSSDVQRFTWQMEELIRPQRVIDPWMWEKIPQTANPTSSKLNLKIIAENKADIKYTVVAAASILAKVQRDQRISEIKEEWGEDFGSGYASDPLTRAALKRWIEHDNLPVFVRQSWDTFQKLKNEWVSTHSRKLDHWIK